MLSPHFFMKSIILMLVLAFAVPAAAEVLESTPNGFAVRNTAEIAGSMTWKLDESVAGTSFEWSSTAGGYMPGGLAAIAPTVDAVLAGQLQRLERFIETGRPE